MAIISPNNTGLSGEYFVAAELYRRGWSVGMTIGNAKSVDIFAEKNERIVSIQVKSIYQRTFSGWPLMENKIKNSYYYIFVILNADKMLSPEYYIATAVETKAQIKQYRTRGIITVSSLKNDIYKDKWEKLEN